MDKRKLYENIMSNVSKQVKKALNEDFNYDAKLLANDFINFYGTMNYDQQAAFRMFLRDICTIKSDVAYDNGTDYFNLAQELIPSNSQQVITREELQNNDYLFDMLLKAFCPEVRYKNN